MQTVTTRHGLLEESDIAALEAEQPDSPTAVEQFNDESTRIDAFIASSIIDLLNREPEHDSILKFKDDLGRAQVVGVSSVLDPEVFLDSLNVRAVKSQFSAVIGATYESDDV